MSVSSGRALVLGDNVNTDALHPSRFYSLDDSKVRRGFLGAVSGRETQGASDVAGRIVVAGRNFGIGSSRETGARVFLLAGIQAVVAVSFARIFYRNVLNLGLAAVECPGLSGIELEDGAMVELNTTTGQVTAGVHRLIAEPLDPHWRRILDAGGLDRYLGLHERPV